MDLVGGRDFVESDGKNAEDDVIEPNSLEEGDALGNTK